MATPLGLLEELALEEIRLAELELDVKHAYASRRWLDAVRYTREADEARAHIADLKHAEAAS